MEKYQGKYRVQKPRASWWNYGHAGIYFITICTEDRINYFGKVIGGKALLSEIGKIVEEEWQRSIELRPDMNLQLGDYVVMPNHFHAIVIIGENPFNAINAADISPQSIAETHQFGPHKKNLASLVRGFKSAVTIRARQVEPGFAWQPRYYDHIIRNEMRYHDVIDYIINNPERWRDDTFYSE